MEMNGIVDLARKAVRKVIGAHDVGGGADVRLIAESGLFDRDFYLSTYPDVAQAGIDPIEHYFRFGSSEGRNPSLGFDTSYYLASNPDVESSGINPLLHFILHGLKEDRSPLPAPREEHDASPAAGAGPAMECDEKLDPVDQAILASGCFDETFYRGQVQGLIGKGESALRHYVSVGALAGMRPNEWFDTSFYLGRYKDVERAGINPFYHFLEFGWKELRSPSGDIDLAWLFLFNEELRSGRLDVPQFLKGRWSGDGFQNRRFGSYSQNDKVKLVNAISSFIEEANADDRTMYAIGKVAERIGASDLARKACAAALEKSPESYRYLRAVCEINRNLGNWSEYLACLERIALLLPESAEYLCKVGVARYRAGDLVESKAAFERSLKIERKEETAYQLGLVCSALGAEKDADLAFAVALRLTNSSAAAKALGPGILHEARGDYVRAAEAFERMLPNDPLNSGLHYRLGHCYERLYRWEHANGAYRRAALLAIGYGEAIWHFRIGFVNERLGRLDLAAVSYRAAIHLAGDRMPEWEYRLGYVLESVGNLQAASEAYLGAGNVAHLNAASAGGHPRGGSLSGTGQSTQEGEELDRYFAQFRGDSSSDVASMDTQHPATASVVDELLAAGEMLECKGDWVGAALSYEAAAARDDNQEPLTYEKAGRAFLRAGMPLEAARSLRLTNLLRRPYGVGIAAVKSNRASLLGAAYLEYMSDLPIIENFVMYESFSGLSMACNPLAIFRYLITAPEFEGFTHVWVINDKSRVPAEYAERSDVVFVSRDSFAYVKYLATAKFLINNSGFPGYFIRRPGQKYLATWHGTPLKTLGKDQKYKFYDHKRTQRNFLHATHIISPNEHSTRVLLDSYDIRTLYGGMFAETGYPRVDLTLSADAGTRAKLRARLSLDDKKKVVLYAPTWRGTPDEVWFDFSKVQHDLEELAKLDCQVIFRGHSWLERAINAAHVHCNVVPADIDTNELLSIVDVLVTDYSSVFFDFFATGKPVVYYIYDIDEYTHHRGLYFDIDDMPGIKCRDEAELREGVRSALTLDVDLEWYAAEFNVHDDGQATRRVVDFFFGDDASHALAREPSGKRRVLMHAGTFQDCAQSRLAIEFANALDPSEYEVVLTFTPSAVELTAGGTDRFRTLPADVIGLPRYGHVLMTPEERWLRRKYEEGRLTESPECVRIVRNVYAREMYRMTGGIEFHAVVVFDGLNPFWTRLLLDGCRVGQAIRVSDDGRWEGLACEVIDVSYEDVLRQGVSTLVAQLRSGQN